LCANLADPVPVGATRGYGPAVVAIPGLLAGHGPLHVVHSRGLVAVAGLWWTCGLDSSVGGQWWTACSWRRCSQ